MVPVCCTSRPARPPPRCPAKPCCAQAAHSPCPQQGTEVHSDLSLLPKRAKAPAFCQKEFPPPSPGPLAAPGSGPQASPAVQTLLPLGQCAAVAPGSLGPHLGPPRGLQSPGLQAAWPSPGPPSFAHSQSSPLAFCRLQAPWSLGGHRAEFPSPHSQWVLCCKPWPSPGLGLCRRCPKTVPASRRPGPPGRLLPQARRPSQMAQRGRERGDAAARWMRLLPGLWPPRSSLCPAPRREPGSSEFPKESPSCQCP